MAVKQAKKAANAHPKVFRVPADLAPLGKYAAPILADMRRWHAWRMSSGCHMTRKKV